jgi:uncharacterized membrane protein
MGDQRTSTKEFFVADVDAEPLPLVEASPRGPLEWCANVWRSIWHWRNVAVIILIAAYVVWFIHLNFEMYYGYGEPPFDLSVFDQGMWLVTHFHTPFVTIMGRNLFGDHLSLVLLLFAPFFRLFPEPQGLLVLQTLLIAGAAIPIYVLARKYIKSTIIATSLVATYLLSPLIQQGNLDQFHPEAFQTLFMAIAIYAAIERKNVVLIVMVVLALMVKEDAALLTVPLGIWVAARRDRRLGWSIIVGSVAWAMIANWLIIPAILGTSSFYSSYLPFGGVGGIFKTLFLHPGTFFSYVWSQSRPFYVWQLVSTVGVAFLFSPEVALIAVLVVAENVISNFGYMHQILYQYSFALAPILVLGVLYAIAQQSQLWRRNTLTAVALVGAVWTCALWGFAPFSDNSVHPMLSTPSVQALNHLEKALPPNAVVSAWYPLDSHVDNRAQIYVWPNPFYAEDWGHGNTTGKRLPSASQVKYLLLPIPLVYGEDPDVFHKIASQYRLVERQSGFALYEKKSPT